MRPSAYLMVVLACGLGACKSDQESPRPSAPAPEVRAAAEKRLPPRSEAGTASVPAVTEPRARSEEEVAVDGETPRRTGSKVVQFEAIDALKRRDGQRDESEASRPATPSRHEVAEFIDLPAMEQATERARRFTGTDECSGERVFEVLYSNGVVGTLPFASDFYILAGAGPTPRGLAIGDSREKVKRLYGEPAKELRDLLVYRCLDEAQLKTDGTREYYEAVRVYLDGGEVVAIAIHRPSPC